MEGNSRATRIIFWCGLVTILVCSIYYGVGGKLGWLILSVYSYFLARQFFLMILTDQPFMLDRKPLPPLLYFLPAPCPPNLWGFLQLYLLPIGFGLLGWHFGGKNVILPVQHPPTIWVVLLPVWIIHFVFALVIFSREIRFPIFISLDEGPPLGSYLMALRMISWHYIKLAWIFWVIFYFWKFL